MVCDVSVEVAVLARLCGVATVAVRQHGVRTDPAHLLAFDLAHRILAPFPQALDTTPPTEPLQRRTFYAGLLTRPMPTSRAPASGAESTLIVATGGGETGLSAVSVGAAADAFPHWHIKLIGQPPHGPDRVVEERANVEYLGWVDDPHAVYESASVVAASAGSNLVADVALANRPLVAVAEDRPFDEQRERVTALRRSGAAVGITAWPTEVDQWRDHVDRALRLGARRLAAMVDPGAAARTARWLERTTNELRAATG